MVLCRLGVESTVTVGVMRTSVRRDRPQIVSSDIVGHTHCGRYYCVGGILAAFMQPYHAGCLSDVCRYCFLLKIYHGGFAMNGESGDPIGTIIYPQNFSLCTNYIAISIYIMQNQKMVKFFLQTILGQLSIYMQYSLPWQLELHDLKDVGFKEKFL